jgi:hypothetical protein
MSDVLVGVIVGWGLSVASGVGAAWWRSQQDDREQKKAEAAQLYAAGFA